MPKNKKEDSDDENEYDQKELSSLEQRRLRVMKREELVKKRKRSEKNDKNKKMKKKERNLLQKKNLIFLKKQMKVNQTVQLFLVMTNPKMVLKK